MKKNRIYLYLYDDEIVLNYNNNIYYIKSKSIEDSNIKNVSLFKQDLTAILKKYRINYGFVSDNITYINIINTDLEKEYIKTILNEFNFKSVTISELSKYLDKKTYILNDKEKIYFLKENIILNSINIEKQINTLKEENIINDTIFVLKYNNKKIIEQMKKSNAQIYYIYNPNDIIFDKFIKRATNM